MRDLKPVWVLGLLLAMPLSYGNVVQEPEMLAATDKHGDVSRKVTELIERFHYARPRLDNSLSSAILDRYLDTLDSNRLYFLSADVGSFSRYR